MSSVFITGTSRGIGLGLARHYLNKPNTRVFMGVRDVAKSAPLFESFKNATLLKFDSSDRNSHKALADRLEADKVKLDLVVNNAGINMANQPQVDVKTRAEVTIGTNFLGIVDLLSPHFIENCVNKNGVIVNVSSKIGDMNIIRDQDTKQKLKDAKEVYELVRIAKDYIKNRDAEKPIVTKTHPWPEYALSKLLLNIYTEILGKEQSLARKHIQVYSWCPGWIKTELGGQQAPGTVEQAVQRFEELMNQATGVDINRQGKLYEDRRFRSVREEK